MLSGSPDEVVLIDGPSGAGKSTFASELAAAWPGSPAPSLVRMDDIYPGWHGLDAASEQVHEELLAPRRSGMPARWCEFDWASGRPGAWHDVDAHRPLIIEGCGVLTAANAPLAAVRIWMDAEDEFRKRRALERDSGAFDAHWDVWDSQFAAFVAREHPLRFADIVLKADPLEADSLSASE